MYNKRIMTLFANPKNVGIIQGASGIGQYTNEQTTDVYKIYLKIENDVVIDASFKAFCGADGIAVCSVLTDMLFDKTLDEVKEISKEDILEKIGGLDEDNSTIEDALTAVDLAITDYYKKLQKMLKKSN